MFVAIFLSIVFRHQIYFSILEDFLLSIQETFSIFQPLQLQLCTSTTLRCINISCSSVCPPKRLRKSHSKAAALDKRPTLISGKNLLHSRNTTALNTVFNNHTKQTNVSHACIIQQALISSLELIFYAILYQKYILLVNTLCKDEYILTTHKHILKIL